MVPSLSFSVFLSPVSLRYLAHDCLCVCLRLCVLVPVYVCVSECACVSACVRVCIEFPVCMCRMFKT